MIKVHVLEDDALAVGVSSDEASVGLDGEIVRVITTDTEPLAVAENGVYTREHGYSPVTVDVPHHFDRYTPSHVVDGKWVRPAEWPDIEALPITDEDGTVYLTYDNTLGLCFLSLRCTTPGSAYRLTYDRGHMDGGAFVVDDTQTVGSNTTYSYLANSNDPDYIVLRITGRMRTFVLQNMAYTNPESTTARNLVAASQPIVERYGSLPFCTSIACATQTIESDHLCDCTELTTLSSCYTGCLSLRRWKPERWDTKNVTSFASMFNGCYLLVDVETNLRGWVTDKCLSLQSMFYSCYSLAARLDLSDWDTSGVTNISGIFSGCHNLPTPAGIETWRLRDVTVVSSQAAYGLFYQCHSFFGSLNLSGWELGRNTDSGLSFSSVFAYCENLSKIDISGWNLKNALTVTSMFAECRSATDIVLPEDALTGGVCTAISSLFSNCKSLQRVDMHSADLSACENIASMCSGCYSLREFIPPASTVLGSSSSSRGTSVFNYCTELENLDLSWYDCAVWTYTQSAQWSSLLTGCRNLRNFIPFRNANRAFTANNYYLTRESLVAIFEALAEVTGSPTVTVGPTNLAKLSDADIAIATEKGWKVA